jgi:ketosteroid isomerase-like protein
MGRRTALHDNQAPTQRTSLQLILVMAPISGTNHTGGAACAILAVPMAHDNVELVTQAYRSFDTDIDGLLDTLDPSIEWVSPADAIEPGTRRGHAGVRAAFAATAMAWEDATHTPDEYLETDERVMVTITFRGHGRGSGMRAERSEFHVWTVRNGSIVRFEWFYQRADALIAAGLAA